MPIAEAFTVNLLLMSVFAIQHSVMARKQFKQWWTRFVPKSVERSTYVLFASLALILLFRQWRPMRAVVWHIEDPQTAMALIGLSCAGWLIVLTSTFLINHSSCSDCIKSPIISLDARCRRRISVPRFTTRSSGIRSISVSSLPFGRRMMTAGHLLFAAVTTAYIIAGIQLEERDLSICLVTTTAAIGTAYRCWCPPQSA